MRSPSLRSLVINLPDGWYCSVDDDEVNWWEATGNKYVVKFPFVPGFFVAVALINDMEHADDPTVTSCPIAGPFRNVLSAIAAARILS